jgi:four helix bundle protein
MNRAAQARESPVELRERTKRCALRIIRLYTALPHAPAAQVLGKQMLRSGRSVGAHYREATRARSNAEFISKLEGGLQELDETIYWMELISDGGFVQTERLASLQDEANQLLSILVACVKNAKSRITKH